MLYGVPKYEIFIAKRKSKLQTLLKSLDLYYKKIIMKQEFILKAIKSAFTEDIGDGDHSSLSCVPELAIGKAKLLVKDNGILAGVEIAKQVFKHFDSKMEFTQFMNDGDIIKNGDIVFEITGASQSILACERLTLNIMQRMSGIATKTAKVVQIIKGTNARLLDTRKTTPNFRVFEKEAVRIGGGFNHRFGLYDMIMLKDNHIDYAGGISKALTKANNYLKSISKPLKIEIEVRSLNELNQALIHGEFDRVMLDNFTPSNIIKAVVLIDGKFETEASGGITEETIRSYAETGVDYISVGALTHQVESLDLSLKAV